MINNYYSRTTLVEQQIDYTTQVGKGLSESVPFNLEGGCNQIGGYDKINQSINDILLTPIGTRFMNPEYGSNLHLLLFANCNKDTCILAEMYITDALGRWEKRIILDEITVVPISTQNTLYIEIPYKLNQSDGRKGKYTFFYDLERGYV